MTLVIFRTFGNRQWSHRHATISIYKFITMKLIQEINFKRRLRKKEEKVTGLVNKVNHKNDLLLLFTVKQTFNVNSAWLQDILYATYGTILLCACEII